MTSYFLTFMVCVYLSVFDRVIWMLIILGSLILFFVAAEGFMVSYGRHRVNTKISYRKAKDLTVRFELPL